MCAAGFTLIELYFIRYQERGVGISIGWHNSFYEGAFQKAGGWVNPVEAYVRWPNLLALLDAALVGIVLTLGLTVGLRLARRWLNASRRAASD